MSDKPEAAATSRDLRHVSIRLNGAGDTHVEIDGVDLAYCVTGFDLTASALGATRLILHTLPQRLTLEGTCEVLKTIREVEDERGGR